VGVLPSANLADRFLIFAVGVETKNGASVSSVRGIDGTSRNNKRLAGVADAFQVRKHRVELHADEPSNILTNDPSGPDFLYNSAHFRPEVTVILLAPSLPGCREWLARKSS
jgi:hypothetical protein